MQNNLKLNRLFKKKIFNLNENENCQKFKFYKTLMELCI